MFNDFNQVPVSWLPILFAKFYYRTSDLLVYSKFIPVTGTVVDKKGFSPLALSCSLIWPTPLLLLIKIIDTDELSNL